MCSLVMSLCSCDTFNGSRLTGLTCDKAPGFWMLEHQLVSKLIADLLRISNYEAFFLNGSLIAHLMHL